MFAAPCRRPAAAVIFEALSINGNGPPLAAALALGLAAILGFLVL
jgi:hypothetical protein